MIISSAGINNYQNVGAINSSVVAGTATTAGSTTSASSVGSTSTNTNASGVNDSNLSLAVKQALAQINSGKDLTAYLSSDSSQSSASDFTSNLFSSLPGLSTASSSAAAGQGTTPVQLDQSSSSFKLQNSIQKLITQLDKTSSGDGTSDTASLQKSFNNLISNSGGNPAQQDLQSFLKLVAANVQGSSSIGSLFSASA
ncbi:hypothetical protein ACO0LB_16320 [Undibacterium sp. SXout7W]|uniref:hypothetical protein n=1 Tax=Undibacterium sp. SXout7W TaxID=3413049 RepID=UPI003BF3D2F7